MARGVAGEFALEHKASEGEEYVTINVRVGSNRVTLTARRSLPVFSRLADILGVIRHVSKVPILLQKSFCGMGLKFSDP
jgi:hypothetical protein